MKIKNKRPIDKIAKNIYFWLGRTFVLIKKTKIKTWQGIFAISLIAGIAIASIAVVSLDIQTKSDAAGEVAILSLSPVSPTVANGGTFSLDIMLDTKNSNVVVARSVVSYDPAIFQLQGFDLSSSVFKSSLDCGSANNNNGACNIVINDTANGKLDLTVFTTAPGVNTSNGRVASLNFKAIGNNVRKEIKLNFIDKGNYSDSDVIASGNDGKDILLAVTNATVTVGTPVVTCTSFQYTSWSACQSNNTQSRQITSSLPTGCIGGSPTLSQSCIYVPTCVTSQSTYSDWSACQPDGTQTKTKVTPMPTGCTGGEEVLTQKCAYVVPTNPCASFEYSDWSACQSDSTQSRTVKSKTPANCVGGINPILSQDCTLACVSAQSTYSDWSACQPSGEQTKTRTTPMPNGCTGGEEVLTQKCAYVVPTNPCASFEYSDWSACQSDSTQSRQVTASLPTACVGGGSPLLTQACAYSKPQEKKKSSSSKKKKKVAARTISNSPTRVARGAILTERGKKFSKNSTVLLYFSKSTGGYYAPMRVNTNSKGSFYLTYRIPTYKTVGTYKWFAVDQKTGKKGKTITYRVK